MVEDEYGILVGYLAKRRCSGDSPVFIKLGRKVYYEHCAIEGLAGDQTTFKN